MWIIAMTKITRIIACLVVLVSLMSATVLSQSVHADSLLNGAQNETCTGVGLGDNSICNGNTASTKINKIVSSVISILSIIIGIAAVIVLMVQGLRFIVSGGDPASVTSARNAILYAVIGIIIAVSAQLLVHFVLSKAT